MDPLHISSWTGMDNIHNDLELPEGRVRNAVNLDFTEAGKIATRVGQTLLSAGEARSGVAFSPYILFVRGGVLHAYHTHSAALTNMGVAVVGDRLAAAVVPGAAYLSDGLSKWKIDLQLGVSAWGYPAADDPVFDVRFIRPMPACRKLVHFQGRMVGAVGRMLFHSLPFVYGAYEPKTGFIHLPWEVKVLHTNNDAVFVAGDEVMVLTGLGTKEQELDYVAAPPSWDMEPAVDPETGIGYWLTSRGIIAVPFNGAKIEQTTLPHHAVRQAERGAAGVLKRNGTTRIVAAVRPDTSVADEHPLVSVDYLKSEEIRQEKFNAL
jgi:hypothetical protein